MRRRRRGLLRLAAVEAGALVVLAASGAFTASTAVPLTRLGQTSQLVTANTLKPSACSAITLTTLITGSGNFFNGTAASELMLGGTGNDKISGLGGDDCLVGGAGNDQLDGGAGTDVCIGGPGTDTFANCETQIQ